MKEKILVVDDDPSMGLLLSERLGLEGYTCRVSQSGEEALTLLGADPADLVICDLRMPGMSGLELPRTLLDRVLQVLLVVLNFQLHALHLQRPLHAGHQ